MYAGFLGFNKKNQFIVRMNYWRDSDPDWVSCGPGSADWVVDPVTNKARLRTSRSERSRK
jgi:hypothetical protein